MFLLGSQSARKSAKKLPSGATADRRASVSSKHEELDEGTWMSRWIMRYYAPFISRPFVQFCVLIGYILYLSAAILGCASVRQGLEPVRLLLPDSYAVNYYRQLEKYFWSIGACVCKFAKFSCHVLSAFKVPKPK